MKYLKELRELRAQEKAIKARIDEVSEEATKEALEIAPEGGEFEVEGVGTFQLQLLSSLQRRGCRSLA